MTSRYIMEAMYYGNNVDEEWITEYVNSLGNFKPTVGTKFKYFIVKGSGDKVSKMRPITTKEELDLEWYEEHKLETTFVRDMKIVKNLRKKMEQSTKDLFAKKIGDEEFMNTTNKYDNAYKGFHKKYNIPIKEVEFVDEDSEDALYSIVPV